MLDALPLDFVAVMAGLMRASSPVRFPISTSSMAPFGVWLILTAVAGISCWTSAYAAGYDGVRSIFTSVLLPLTVSLVLVLIFDLTHERQGIIGISQQPLVDLQSVFRSGPHAPTIGRH